MLNKMSALSLSIFLIACGKQDEADSPAEISPCFRHIKGDCSLPIQAENTNLLVKANLKNFSSNNAKRMITALEKLEVAINSQEFKEAILNFQYNGKTEFADNLGYSNEQIYGLIQRAAEKLTPTPNGEINIDLKLYYNDDTVVGYTYPNTPQIWVNKKFFYLNNYGQIAGNIAHEWIHKLGFDHSFEPTPKRNFTVPYGVGRIIEKIVKKL